MSALYKIKMIYYFNNLLWLQYNGIISIMVTTFSDPLFQERFVDRCFFLFFLPHTYYSLSLL